MSKKILRALGWVAGALVVVVVVGGCGLYFVTQRGIDKQYDVAGHDVNVPTDSLALVRGEHVATIGKCAECHNADFGGRMFIDAPPVAQLYAANLTSGKGGVAPLLKSNRDWERAIRHAVKPDGAPLKFMPSLEFQFLSDDDLGALIAYIKSRPPVDREPQANHVGPIGRLLYAKGDLALIPAERVNHATHPAPVPMAVTKEYGAYLAEIGGCTGCHGEGFSGGKIPGTPPDWKPAANITPKGIGHYTEEDFFRALREGKRPGGAAIDSLMPYRFTKLMTDDEIRALWLFIKQVPPKEYGGR